MPAEEWDKVAARTRRPAARWSPSGGDSVNAIAFSPDGMYFAVGGAFQNAQLSISDVSAQAELTRANRPN
jgi:hypothetical protein